MSEVQVNLLTRSMRLKYYETQLTEQEIIAAVEQAGYGASSAMPTKTNEDSAILHRLVGSFLFLLPLVYLHHFQTNTLSLVFQFVLIIPIIINGRDFEAGKELKNSNIIDIAPTVTKLLGVEPDSEWEGKPLV